jgi:hypothetical protein
MERVILERGQFALVQAEGGFAWTMTSGAGSRWYWHPQSREWTAYPISSPTPEAAAGDFDPDLPQAQGRSECRAIGPHRPPITEKGKLAPDRTIEGN